MVTDGNRIYCDDHFTCITNIKLCCIPEKNIILCINYTSVKFLILKKQIT